MWFLNDDGAVKMSLNVARQKTKNLTANPAANLFILDTANPARYLEIRGDATLEPDPDYAFADRLGAKYGGVDLRDMDGPDGRRVVVTINPVRVNAVDLSALRPHVRLLLAEVARQDQLVVGAQLLGCLVDDELAVRQHVAAVGDRERDVDVLLDQQHGTAALLGVRATRPAAGARRSPAPGRATARRAAAVAAVRASARPSASICCSPPDSRPARRSAMLGERREVLVGDVGVEPLAAVSEPEVLGDGEAEEHAATLRHVGDAELCPRGGRAARRCRSPSTRITPAIGRTRPEIARSVVVLPAPFGPSRATTSPAPTCRSRSRTTAAAS